jgi:hypothetical protein
MMEGLGALLLPRPSSFMHASFRLSSPLFAGTMLTLCLAHSAVVRAQPLPGDDKHKAAARQLAQDGARAYEKGNYQRAHALLRRAHALVPAPTIALLEARALVHMNRFVEASERYELARRYQLDAHPPPAFTEAVKHADRELTELRPRIPLLTIRVTGNALQRSDSEVRIDGSELPRPLVGVRHPVDPGSHVVELVVDDEVTARQSVTLAEGSNQSVVLEGGDVFGESQRTWGYVTLGVGAAGLATGAVAGVIMLNKKSDLDDVCTPSCPPSSQGDLDSFRRARTISFVGYGVGLVGVGLGTVLLLTAPSSTPTSNVQARIGPGSLTVAGRF